MALSSTQTIISSTPLPYNRFSSSSSCTAHRPAAVSKRPSTHLNGVIGCTRPPRPHRVHSRVRAAQHSPELRNHQQYAGGAVPAPPEEASYTSMRADPPGFWDAHKGLIKNNMAAPSHDDNGLLFKQLEAEQEDEALFLAAELRLLANAASDRAEMHSILAEQRDNWNKLFQRMLTATSMTACVLSGLDSQAHSLGLSLPALLLNAGGAAMMAIINQFQPSQLAEEQRTASRLFGKLVSDIHYALHVAPHLRQDAPSFLRDCKRRLQALDKAFPMPLTPGGLEKFPAKVVPPVLIEPQCPATSDNDDHSLGGSANKAGNHNTMITSNGWDEHLTRDLQHVATLLRRSDIPKYTRWAQNLVKVNKCLAMAAPLFAASAAMLNAIVISTSMLPNIWGMWAAVCSVLATFAGSFSNDMQLGMVFELYRNSAGYYADVEASIQETLGAPVQQRENGSLFRQRIAYQLGRWPTTSSAGGHKSDAAASDYSTLASLVPSHCKEAGTLF